MLKMGIGERIESLRDKKGWKQNELAKRLGISKSVMSRIEAEIRPLENTLLVKMAEILDTSADYIVGTNYKKPNVPQLDLSDDDILSKADVVFEGKPIDQKAFKEAVQYLRVKSTQK